MSAQTARIMEMDPAVESLAPKQETLTPDGQDDFLLELTELRPQAEYAWRELHRCLADVYELRSENRWEDIVALFHPVEEKCPDLCAAGMATRLRGEVAFALGFLQRFEDAIAAYHGCLQEDEANFKYHAGLAYTAYDSLYAALSRKLIFHPRERKNRIDLAHRHFSRAQQLRPESVSNYYRQGMLFKQIQKKTDKALPLFKTAIANWCAYTPEQQQAHHQEYKNYIKALYHAAACLQEPNPRMALKLITDCIEADRSKNYLSAVNKHFALGKVHFLLRDLPAARQALEAAAALGNPASDNFVFELLGRVHLYRKEPGLALEVLHKVPANCRRPYFRWTEADALIALNRVSEAKRLLQNAAERDRRGKHKALLRLVNLAYREGDWQNCLKHSLDADRFFRETYQNPCADALFWASAARFKLGLAEEAQQTCEELRTFRPNYPNLNRLEALLGTGGKPALQEGTRAGGHEPADA